MGVTTTPRMGLTRWSNSATDPFTRAQMDASHASLEALAARDEQGTLAARPAPALQGRYYFATDATALYRDTGAAFVQVATIPAANNFTGTVSLNADAVTPAVPAYGAALGVNRNVSGGGVFLSLNNSAVSGATTWGIGTYTAGELGFGTTFAAGAWSGSSPVLLVGPTGQIQAAGAQNNFGQGAVTGSSAYVTLGNFSTTTQAFVGAAGSSATVDMVVRSQGTGGVVWLQPNSDTSKGVKVGPLGTTFLQYVSITGGGLDVAGSPSGYEAEVRSPLTSSSPTFAFSTLGSGTPSINMDHRGGSNTGQWVWRNGTNAATWRMQLTSTGHLVLTSDVTSTLTAGYISGMSLWGNGFAYVADGVAPQGSITAGGTIAINRTAPALTVTNGAGDSLQLYGSGYLKTLSSSTLGTLYASTGGAAANATGLDVYGSPNVGYAAIKARTQWGDGNTGGLLLQLDNAFGTVFAIRPSGKLLFGASPTGSLTSTTATAGPASALPANPRGYLTIELNGTDVKVPYYNT